MQSRMIQLGWSSSDLPMHSPMIRHTAIPTPVIPTPVLAVHFSKIHALQHFIYKQSTDQ